jgi:hypothetical protein
MKTPKKCRNRCKTTSKAALTPVIGAGTRIWLAGFCERLPEYAARLGMTTAEAASRADAIRAQFMKTTNAPSTP